MSRCTRTKIVLDDEILALLLLSSLLDSWETNLVVSLSNFASNGKLIFDVVNNSLLNEETKTKGGSKVMSYTQNEAL